MQKSNPIQRLTSLNFFPYMLFFFGLLVYHFCIRGGWGDDEWFYSILDNMSKREFIKMRYETWSSRLIIDYLLVSFVRIPILWKLLDSAVMVLALYSIAKIADCTSGKPLYTLMALLILVPANLYISTGWISTTLNYLWPFSLGLYSLTSIKKIISGEKIACFEYIFFFLAGLYGSNHEQMCALMVGFFCLFFVYMLCTQKKIHLFPLFMSAVSISCMGFILTAPGNAIRRTTEVNRFFQEFDSLSLFTHLEMGYSSTWFEFLMQPNIVFVLFAALLFSTVYARRQSVLIRWVAACPLIISVMFGVFADMFSGLFPVVDVIRNSLTRLGTGITISTPKTLFPDMVISLAFGCVLVALYNAFTDKKRALLAVIIAGAGFCSRMIMSFSPTIWESESRTFFFMYQSFIICTMLLFREFASTEKKSISVYFENAVFALSFLAIMNIL